MDRTLFELTSDMRAIEDALYDNGGELTPELELQLTHTREALTAKVGNYGMLIRKFKYTVSTLAEEIKRLQAMKKTAENGEKRLKERLEYNMRINDINVLEAGFTRVSFRRNAPSVVVDEDVLLEPYMGRIQELIDALPPYVKVKVEVSKDAIKSFEKETGIMPAGAEFVQTESLMIR